MSVLQKDILSDECDKDSGYEPDQVHLWPRHTAAKRAQFRQKKQRSLDVHDVRWLGVAVALVVKDHWDNISASALVFLTPFVLKFACLCSIQTIFSANFIQTYYFLVSLAFVIILTILQLATWAWAATLQLPSLLHKVLPFFR